MKLEGLGTRLALDRLHIASTRLKVSTKAGGAMEQKVGVKPGLDSPLTSKINTTQTAVVSVVQDQFGPRLKVY